MSSKPDSLLKPRETMVRTFTLTSLAALLAATALTVATPAQAQIGTIFSDPPPRPPGAIPRGQPQPQMPDEDDEEVPALPPQGRVLPSRPMPPPQGRQGNVMPGPVESQPLAPPPGSAAAPPNQVPPVAVAPPQGAPGAPGQRQPQQKGGPVPQTPASLQPGDEVVTEPPAQKIVNKKATFSGLDKITGRIINFDEDIGETVQFGALRVKTDACYTRPATEAANTDAFVEVDEITLQGEVKRIFSGWMYAASPGLHGVEHPIYDIWLTDCKEPQQTIATAAPDPANKPATAPPPPAQKKAAPKQAVQQRPPQPLPPIQQQQPAPPPPPPPEQRPGLFGIPGFGR
ncbi:DUF2155 domain-containing protein [Bradyrhizobium cosmicum]|uniref:DUF2155 domain-containing protein n=1 Tax=Bradyrhizobium cosmicum TaxID=1404864 RepID=UPI0011622033|nr:DUF2155 domain-containing protein [Bradyrhizobium cosmicum]QDP25900.1 DUF2155 domain-containing protein [Bradyrhizobium cosmicum]